MRRLNCWGATLPSRLDYAPYSMVHPRQQSAASAHCQDYLQRRRSANHPDGMSHQAAPGRFDNRQFISAAFARQAMRNEPSEGKSV